jgi:hypothetical protein
MELYWSYAKIILLATFLIMLQRLDGARWPPKTFLKLFKGLKNYIELGTFGIPKETWNF